jgi:hypothetical protein
MDKIIDFFTIVVFDVGWLQIVIPIGILLFFFMWESHAIITKKGTRIKYYHVLLSSLFAFIFFSFSAYLGYFVFAEITGQLFYLTVLCLILNIASCYGIITHEHIPALKKLKNGEKIISQGITPPPPPWKWKDNIDPEEETLEREEKEKEEKERLKPFWKRRNFWINTLINIGILWLIWEIWLK